MIAINPTADLGIPVESSFSTMNKKLFKDIGKSVQVMKEPTECCFHVVTMLENGLMRKSSTKTPQPMKMPADKVVA